MTRPASFNNTWAENVDPGQYADESTDTTISFMKTGWEGGSDKKAPSAKTQNYHMRKHDLAMQESERQGMLSWRSDVPYPAGARTWWHGNVFIALSDNQGVEPQGGNDNGIWFLSPVENYPTTWGNISGKPETATRWPDYNEVKNTPLLGTASSKDVEYFDKSGEASRAVENRVIRDGITILGVRSDDKSYAPYIRKDSGEVVNLSTENDLNSVKNSMSAIAKTGVITDALGDFPWNRVDSKPPWTNNVYTGDGDTVVTSNSGTGKLSINDEWINFYPSQKGSCFAVGPDGRIYNASINHDQVLGLGSAALTPITDYEKSGEVNGLRNSLSEIAFTGAWASLLNTPAWVPRIYAGSSNSATGILSSSGKTRLEVTDEWLNFFPVSGESSKLTIGKDGILSNCTLPLASIIGYDSLATKLGAGQLVVTKENNGYIRFENGTILQFATGDFGVNETAMWINFPTPFPNACIWAGVSTRLLSDNNDTNTWFQLISWDSYTAKVYRQIVDSGSNKQQTAPYIFAIGR